VIGYDSSDGSFESIYSITKKYHILEWISTDFDAYKDGSYSGFIDLDKSDRDTNKTYSPKTTIDSLTDDALIFSGAFDEGELLYAGDFNDSFGWHGHGANKIFGIKPSSSGADIYLDKQPEVIYEKYSLINQAFAIARYDDINLTASCIDDLNLSDEMNEHTLFLFFNYKPWKGETFCADKRTSGVTPEGNVTILSNETSGFEVDFIDGNLQFNISLERVIKKPGKDLNISISKQKVVY
jgi:hypothetical protein